MKANSLIALFLLPGLIGDPSATQQALASAHDSGPAQGRPLRSLFTAQALADPGDVFPNEPTEPQAVRTYKGAAQTGREEQSSAGGQAPFARILEPLPAGGPALNSRIRPIVAHAAFLRQSRRYAEALAELDKAHAIAPDDPVPSIERAICYLAQRNRGMARRVIEAAAKQYPQDPSVHMEAAFVCLVQKDPDGMIAHATRAVAALPGDAPAAVRADAHTLLGKAFWLANLRPQAHSEFELSMNIDPGNLEAPLSRVNMHLQEGAWVPAVAGAKELLVRIPAIPRTGRDHGRLTRRTAQMYASIAEVALGVGRRRAAERWNRESLRLDPSNTRAIAVAEALRPQEGAELRHWEAAENYLKLAGADPEAYYYAGRAALDAAQRKRASALAHELQAMPGGNVYGCLLSGEIELKEGRMDEALAWARQAEALEPEGLGPQQLLTRVMHRWRNWPDTITAARAALQLDPGDGAVRWRLGEALASQRHWNQAVEQYDQVLESDPNDTAARYLKAVALVRLANYGRALAEAHELFRRFPETVLYRIRFIRTLLSAGKRGLAEKEFLDAIAIKLFAENRFLLDLRRDVLSTPPAPNRDPERSA